MQKFRNDFLNEEYFFDKHDSGLKIYLVPKPDYKASFAMIGTCYGSINKKFKVGNDFMFSCISLLFWQEYT